jgi:hypothetical protein
MSDSLNRLNGEALGAPARSSEFKVQSSASALSASPRETKLRNEPNGGG